MSGLLPSEMEPDVSADDDGELRVLSLEDEGAQELIASLSSDTARSIYSALHDEPSTASELSETVSTSLQNVRHHLSNLAEAELVEVAGTRYSCKGREMKVYAPTGDSLVVCVGSEADSERLADSLGGIVGVVAVLGDSETLRDRDRSDSAVLARRCGVVALERDVVARSVRLGRVRRRPIRRRRCRVCLLARRRRGVPCGRSVAVRLPGSALARTGLEVAEIHHISRDCAGDD